MKWKTDKPKTYFYLLCSVFGKITVQRERGNLLKAYWKRKVFNRQQKGSIDSVCLIHNRKEFQRVSASTLKPDSYITQNDDKSCIRQQP